MLRRRVLLAMGLGSVAAACASIIGADFNGYSAKNVGAGGDSWDAGSTGGISSGTGGGSGGSVFGTQCTPPNPIECPSDTRCEFTSDGSTPICAGPAGTGGPYSSCASNADCRNDLGCRQVGALLDGTAVSFCLPWATNGTQCGSNEQFVLPGNAPVYGGRSYGYCYGSCDPTNPLNAGGFRACSGVDRCTFLKDSSGTQSVTACFPPGTDNVDVACLGENDCTSGLACRSVCVPYCRVGNDTTCPTGQTCNSFTNIRKIGTTEFGYCRDPNNCDPVTGTPCLSGTRCYLAVDDFAVCSPDTGTRKLGEECGSFSQCTSTDNCIGSDSAGYYCSQYCRVGSSDCGTATCNSLQTKEFLSGVEYGYCDPPNCNPFDQYAGSPFVQCTSGLTCRFSTSMTAHCQVGTGTVAQGASCNEARDCQSGSVCVFWNGAGSCYPACRTSLGTTGNPDCGTAYTTCYTFTTSNVMSGMEVGYCGN